MTKFYLDHAMRSVGQPFELVDGIIHADGHKYRNSYGSWIMCAGDYGLGKSGLAVSLARELRKSGYYVVYVRLPDFIETYKKSFGMSSREQNEFVNGLERPLVEADYLVVDEASVEGNADNEASEYNRKLFMNKIIQPRWAARTTKPTVFTCNLKAKEFQTHWGDMIAQRVFENAHWLTMRGVRLRHSNMPIEE